MRFYTSAKAVFCFTLPLLAAAAPYMQKRHTKMTTTVSTITKHRTTTTKPVTTKTAESTTTKSTKSTTTKKSTTTSSKPTNSATITGIVTTSFTKASAPPVTAPTAVAANYCGVTGLNGGLSPYFDFTYTSHGISNDEPTCENACLADPKCQSFFITVNTYASPATATCNLFDLPIDAYIADRGYNAGAAPPSIINYFYDRAICFPSSEPSTTTTTSTLTATPPAVTVPTSVQEKYCGLPGDLPSTQPYEIYSFSYSGETNENTIISDSCEVNCLNDSKCLTYMGYLEGGYGQCWFYNLGIDALGVTPDESSAYFWDKDKCFPYYAS